MDSPQPAAAPSSRLTVDTLDSAAAAEQAAGLMDAIWRARGVMPANLIRAIAHAGGYAAGAWDGTSLLGASVGFLGRDDDGTPLLHSHITGVRAAGRGVGMVLKRHQREWCRARGIPVVTWTFDPLVSRNAWFNLGKLGATATAYLVDHYGDMRDGVNADQGSDRLHVRWDVAGSSASAPRPGAAPLDLLVSDHDQAPVVVEAGLHADGWARVAVPDDIEGMRRVDPDMARRWRHAVRATMGAAMALGWVAVAYDRTSGYLLAPPRGVSVPAASAAGTEPEHAR